MFYFILVKYGAMNTLEMEAGTALAQKMLEPEKLPVSKFCRQFLEIDTSENIGFSCHFIGSLKEKPIFSRKSIFNLLLLLIM